MKQTDKNIKEIRIYHSLWKNILLTVGGSNNIVVFLTIQYYCLSLRHE
jgi:hypothetical protein